MTDFIHGEEDHRDTIFLQYILQDAEKALGNSNRNNWPMIILKFSKDSQTPSDSPRTDSIMSNRGSEMYDIFDPNIDNEIGFLGFYFSCCPAIFLY
jgi:hypothetical protein